MEEEENRQGEKRRLSNKPVILEEKKKPRKEVITKKSSKDETKTKFGAKRMQTLYAQCMIDFIKARYKSDHFDLSALFHKTTADTLFDAREIYFDAERCYERIDWFVKNSVKDSADQKSYQNTQMYKMLLANTDALLVTAFIFTFILTPGHKNLTSNNIKEVRGQGANARYALDLTQTTIGEEMNRLWLVYKDNSKGAKADDISIDPLYHRIHNRGLVQHLYRKCGMNRELALFMFDDHQLELDKSADGSKTRQYKNMRAIETKDKLNQNADALVYTLDNIFNDDERFQRVCDLLETRTDNETRVTPDLFVQVYKQQNEDFPHYDNRWHKEYVIEKKLRGARKKDGSLRKNSEKELEAKKVWRVWELYETLCKKKPALPFHRALDRYVLSRKSNNEISMQDMNNLLYEATLPFYSAENECLLSHPFHMVFDFCFLLREQHRRFGNALQYVTLLKELMDDLSKWRHTYETEMPVDRKDASLRKNEERVDRVNEGLSLSQSYQECAIFIDFGGRVNVELGHFSLYMEAVARRRLDDVKIDSIIRLSEDRYPGLKAALSRLRVVLIHTPYVYHYVKEVVLPLFSEYVWHYVTKKYKREVGLGDATPVYLNKSDMRRVKSDTMRRVDASFFLFIPSVSRESVFDVHFRADARENNATSKGTLEDTYSKGIDDTMDTLKKAIESLYDEGDIMNDNENIIRRLATDMVTKSGDLSALCGGPLKRLVLETLLIEIFSRTIESNSVNTITSWSLLAQTRQMRRDLDTDIDAMPLLCVDQQIIGMIEANPVYYRVFVADQGFTIAWLDEDNGLYIGESLINDTCGQPLGGFDTGFVSGRYDTRGFIQYDMRHGEVELLGVNKKINDLKVSLRTMLKNEPFLLILRTYVTGVALPRQYSYQIINDFSLYDDRPLSDEDDNSELFVLTSASFVNFFPRTDKGRFQKDDLVEKGANTIVIVETRSRRRDASADIFKEALSFPGASFDDLCSSVFKRDIFARYNSDAPSIVCINYVASRTAVEDENILYKIIVIREVLDDKEGGSLFDATSSGDYKASLSRYSKWQQGEIKKYEEFSLKNQKAVDGNTSEKKKAKNPRVPKTQKIPEADAHKDVLELTTPQRTLIYDAYKKRLKEMSGQDSMRRRRELMHQVTTELLKKIFNEAQLKTVPTLKKLMDLYESDDDEEEKARTLNRIIKIENDLIAIIMKNSEKISLFSDIKEADLFRDTATGSAEVLRRQRKAPVLRIYGETVKEQAKRLLEEANAPLKEAEKLLDDIPFNDLERIRADNSLELGIDYLPVAQEKISTNGKIRPNGVQKSPEYEFQRERLKELKRKKTTNDDGAEGSEIISDDNGKEKNVDIEIDERDREMFEELEEKMRIMFEKDEDEEDDDDDDDDVSEDDESSQ